MLKKTLLAAAAAAAALLTAGGPAAAQTAAPIKVSYQPALYWALPFYIAAEKGWWRDVGLVRSPNIIGPPRVRVGAEFGWRLRALGKASRRCGQSAARR